MRTRPAFSLIVTPGAPPGTRHSRLITFFGFLLFSAKRGQSGLRAAVKEIPWSAWSAQILYAHTSKGARCSGRLDMKYPLRTSLSPLAQLTNISHYDILSAQGDPSHDVPA